MTMDSLSNPERPCVYAHIEERKDVMQRRIGSLTLITVGVALIAGTFAFQMFSRAARYTLKAVIVAAARTAKPPSVTMISTP